MGLDENDVERTIEATQKTLNMFEQLESEFRRMTEEKESLARGLGAESFSQLVSASQKGMTEEARKKLQDAQEALAKELQEDAWAAELQFRQDQSSSRGSGATRARRVGRMI